MVIIWLMIFILHGYYMLLYGYYTIILVNTGFNDFSHGLTTFHRSFCLPRDAQVVFSSGAQRRVV